MIGWWLCKLGLHAWGNWLYTPQYAVRYCQRSFECDAMQIR